MHFDFSGLLRMILIAGIAIGILFAGAFFGLMRFVAYLGHHVIWH